MTLRPFPRPFKLRLAALIWQVLLHLTFPVLVLAMLRRSRKEPLYRARFLDRLGLGARAPKGGVWIFATSLGETRAASPLVRALLAQGHHVHMTHNSPAGLTESKRLFGDQIAEGRLTYGYMAADLFWALGFFFWRNRPAVGIVVEAEIWPGMLMAARRFGVPMVHVNGNLVDASVTRDLNRWGGVRLMLFQGFQKVLTKSEAHVQRYLRAGVLPERLHLVGELKFEQDVSDAHTDAALRVAGSWGSGRKTFMIASSIEAEEDALFDIVGLLLSHPERPRILWVPRSPQRFDTVARRAQDMGWSVARRSDTLAPDLTGDVPADADVIIGDSIGEMNFYYQLADLVFVGATIADHGGHNIIEPLALNRPVIIGPSIWGITFPAEDAIAEGAIECLPVAELGAGIQALLENPRALSDLSDKARAFHAKHAGAVENTMDELASYLPELSLTLTPATMDDAEALWQWRNAPDVRALSMAGGAFPLSEHLVWMRNALNDPDMHILICWHGNRRCGVVRLDRSDTAVTLSIITDPDFRGTGLSTRMLENALVQCPYPDLPFRALVRPMNKPSLKLFTRLGFQPINSGDPVEFMKPRTDP